MLSERHAATGITSVAVDDGAIWTTDSSGYVTSPEGDPPTRTRVGHTPVDIATRDGDAWLASYDDGTLTRLDTMQRRVAATVDLGRSAVAVAAGDHLVAVAVQARVP
jgi:streptogramin lyase